MAAVLRALISFRDKPIDELSPREARRQKATADAVRKLLDDRDDNTDPEGVGQVVNRFIDGPDGDIAIRIYTPTVARVEGQALPVVLYIHGGGWVIANLDVYDASARAVCVKAHAIVVSTHYRQAPEHDDTYAAYKWVLANAEDIGGDPTRVAVVGEWTGGNMAGVICLRAGDDGLPMPLHQVLVYPVADNDMTHESYREMLGAIPLNVPAMHWLAKHYLDGTNGGMQPLMWLNKANLSGLPPTTTINAELDPLRTEGEILAAKLRDAGVSVTQRTYPGVTHEFFGMSAVLHQARDAQKLAGRALREALGTGM